MLSNDDYYMGYAGPDDFFLSKMDQNEARLLYTPIVCC